MKKMELYVHIPFCVRKCNYCDFLSFPSSEEERKNYIESLCQEIAATGPLTEGYLVDTIFIGGGTPSLIEPKDMTQILMTIRDSFAVNEEAEISMEANPGTLHREKLQAYHQMGINRLSIGLQTTDDACLECLGRIHTFEEFTRNYQEARAAGFDNINIDLMSALPSQTLSSYKNTLEVVTALHPEHISSYSLILEEGTPFYEDEALLDLLPDEDTERRMYEMTKEILHEHGYERYEISNYAKVGKECRHNLGYWDDVPYLGLGLGASSYWEGARFSNESDLSLYNKKPFVKPDEREDYHQLTMEEQMEEYMFLGLRKGKGVSVKGFEERFGKSMAEVYGQIIEGYQKMHLLIIEGDRLRLTDAGIDVSNHIFSEFLLD